MSRAITIPPIITNSLSHLVEGNEIDDAYYWYTYPDKYEELKAFFLICDIEEESRGFIYIPDDKTLWGYPTVQINLREVFRYYKKKEKSK